MAGTSGGWDALPRGCQERSRCSGLSLLSERAAALVSPSCVNCCSCSLVQGLAPSRCSLKIVECDIRPGSRSRKWVAAHSQLGKDTFGTLGCKKWESIWGNLCKQGTYSRFWGIPRIKGKSVGPFLWTGWGPRQPWASRQWVPIFRTPCQDPLAETLFCTWVIWLKNRRSRDWWVLVLSLTGGRGHLMDSLCQTPGTGGSVGLPAAGSHTEEVRSLGQG